MVDYPTIYEGFSSDRPPLVLTYQVDDGNDLSNSTPQKQSITKIIELPQSANLSILSHPVHVYQSTYIYINTSGNIVLYDTQQDLILNEILNVNALLDGRIVFAPRNPLDDNNKNNYDDDGGNETKLFAVYTGATSYSHCVLGDCLEGSTLLFIQVTQQLNQNDTNGSYSYSMTIERNITLPSGTVYEGVSPMFIENGETIVTTVANTKKGAWLRTYNVYCGDIISESSHLGWGWRHVLFYNNFAPDGSSGSNGYDDPLYSLVDVLTPHVRKELEFFDIASSGSSSSSAMMELRTKTSKYTTHDIGSRIFDTGISGDLNGDGANEAILLDENLQNLVSFQLLLINDDGGASVRTQEVWSIPLVGKLSSNIAAVSYSNEDESGVALAAASGNTVRVWISPSSQENALTSTSSTTTSPPTTAS